MIHEVKEQTTTVQTFCYEMIQHQALGLLLLGLGQLLHVPAQLYEQPPASPTTRLLGAAGRPYVNAAAITMQCNLIRPRGAAGTANST